MKVYTTDINKSDALLGNGVIFHSLLYSKHYQFRSDLTYLDASIKNIINKEASWFISFHQNWFC